MCFFVFLVFFFGALKGGVRRRATSLGPKPSLALLLFKASKAPLLTLRVATLSGAHGQAPLELCIFSWLSPVIVCGVQNVNTKANAQVKKARLSAKQNAQIFICL